MTLSLHLLTHIHSKHVAALWEVANKTDVDDFLHDWFSSICHGCEWEGTLQYSTITLSASHILVLSVLQTGSYVLHVESLFDKAAKCNQYCALELVFIPKVSLYLWSFWCLALVVFSNVDLPTVAQTSLFAQDSTSSISCLIRVLEQVKRSVITGRLRPQLFEVGCKFYIAFRSVHFGVFHTCVWGLDSHVLPFLFLFARWHAQSSHVPTSHRD